VPADAPGGVRVDDCAHGIRNRSHERERSDAESDNDSRSDS
jgi:hypothetical protein